jgi:hypothetical protein
VGDGPRGKDPGLKIGSWEAANLDAGRAAAFVAIVAASFFSVVIALGTLLDMGSVSFPLAMMAAGVAGYLAFTAPGRMLRAVEFQQTREAPAFAASSNIYLKTTGSRSKTLLMLRAEERDLASYLAQVRRRTLLGYDAASSTRESGTEGRVLSESVRTVISSVVGVDQARVEEGAEELEGVMNASGLDDETKLPVFVAVSFFLPIMLMLFAAMTKETSIVAIAALVALEVVVLDLTLAASESSIRWTDER